MSHVVLDPQELARAQLARDLARTARARSWIGGAWLFQHKIDRMSPSPLAFLRGAAPLFYEILERIPVLADGPPGQGVIVGDLHMENFGAYRADAHVRRSRADGAGKNAEAVAVFDLNDFDDCGVGPWRFDLLRLTTSLILAGRELGADGREALALAEAMLASYARTVDSGSRRLPPAPRTVQKLLAQATDRDRRALLFGRTERVGKHRRFVRGPRYAELSRSLAGDAARAFEAYVAAHVPEHHRDAHEIRDLAFCVAGTGSLGCLRVAVMVAGKERRDGEWIFDMKEEDPRPSFSRLVTHAELTGAERVEAGVRACLADVPRALGRTTLRGLPMLVRRLTPQEDRLDLRTFPSRDLDALARLLGALVGRAHHRGATLRPKRSWTAADRSHVIDSAARLAGMHEAAYLAFCRLAPARAR